MSRESSNACSTSALNSFMTFNPMEQDYKSTSVRDDAEVEVTDKRKIPCKFHNGISGKCWKGADCQYGHQIYTGGVFSERIPLQQNAVWSAAAESVRKVPSIMNLAPQCVADDSFHLDSEITFAKTPSEFYIRLNNDNQRSEHAPHTEDSDVMDRYYFGLNSSEIPNGLDAERDASFKLSEKLTSFLQTGERYRFLRAENYFPKVELVAARVNSIWNRALVLRCCENERLNVLLIDTGEVHDVQLNDVCQLPEPFCQRPPEVIKCSLYGVSPVIGLWSSDATEYFKGLVEHKKMTVHVRFVDPDSENFSILEKFPIFVDLKLAGRKGREVDVAEVMAKHGGFKWSRTE